MTRPRAKEVASEVGGEHLVADLGDREEIEALGLGTSVHADILVNNAGFQHVAPIEDFDPDTFAAIHRVMLQAPFLLARALLPGMYAAGWGRMIHVSSAHGHRASAYKSAYVSAKHGLEGLSKVIALEGADKGVTSNTVCPGYVRTPSSRARSRTRPPPTASPSPTCCTTCCSPAPRSSASWSRTRWPAWSPSSAARARARSPEPPM